MHIAIASLGFLFYFIYDINSICWKNRALQKLFMIGSLCIAGSTIHMIYKVRNLFLSPGPRVLIFGILSLIFFGALVYTLFFALPFEETYVADSESRTAYTQGVYGLCRHPGVLWFAGAYGSLAAMTAQAQFLLLALILTFWNVLYIIFQDIWTFPKTFSNYEEYKKSAPFLIPNAKSIRYSMKTRRKFTHKTNVKQHKGTNDEIK